MILVMYKNDSIYFYLREKKPAQETDWNTESRIAVIRHYIRWCTI